MRHSAGNLSEVYDVLADLSRDHGPLAVCDFICGELGYEALLAQAVCGRFYDLHSSRYPVVALTWKGCSITYANVSHHQVELQDAVLSTLGNVQHRGEYRWAKLVLLDHRTEVERSGRVTEHLGPLFWIGGHVNDPRLVGYIRHGFLHFTPNRAGIIRAARERLVNSGFVFLSMCSPHVQDSYIAIFDRNEPPQRKPGRNTPLEWLGWARRLADIMGVKLVVVSGLNPREEIDADVFIKPAHRDLYLIHDIIHFSKLFITPPCGIGELACILGCNLYAPKGLGSGTRDFQRMLEGRGFRMFYKSQDVLDWSSL